ncbi:glutamine synthetase [Pseudobacteriovorax antillogorgiicola]|uniref:Glutamine synthetase n=1 Tax=Pseudobacteriovorax antillogorgiicola TaxID=1513793 RepID=A0A1Y6CNV4_9BACT|nr:glutamine synthetase family protein [Pseudobacteriovorax antillogorgiicola]TCS44604.1 L-glutamine synthetase [Pseudobacteriovorax antillogorgiicola]SMF78210.1 glutamine synthetase [Pseudobacteriovorax antillogorgiicola]
MSEPIDPKLLEKIENTHHKKVKVAIVDMDGVLRGKYIHKEKFLSAMKSGFGFCNVVFGWDAADVCYDNVSYAGWHTGYPDADVRLDPKTFRTIPWEDHVPFFLGEFVDDQDQPLGVCPRQLLKKVCARAETMGFKPRFGVEYEWFNFDETPDSLHSKDFRGMKPLTPGMFGYSALRSSYASPYFHDLMDLLEEFDVPLEGLHTETGPGVYEAAIMNCDAATQGDRAILFKTAVKEIAYRHNILPTFMARWNTELPGSSGHIHQSLWDDDRNLFFDANDDARMSPLFKHYLAGQIKLLPEILPMFAPTMNSYKRLVEGFWAPTRANWGIDNRTVAFRVIPGSAKSCRVEARVGGADMNPYLSIAASLAAGLYGIEHKLELDSDPIRGNGYNSEAGTALASNLEQAAQLMGRSEIASELFGAPFVEHFVNTRLWEWRQAQQAVTDWELKRYFEII